MLATSRLRLMLPFERVVPVNGLSLMKDGGPSDAVTLFVDRMTAAGAHVPTHEADVEVVRRICEGLDGMALSIELAAARAPSLGLAGLLSALSSNLQILPVGSRTDDRHRSLRAAIDWYEELGVEPGPDARALRDLALIAPTPDCGRLAPRCDAPTDRPVGRTRCSGFYRLTGRRSRVPG